jgi:hypothetical protein
MAKVDDAIYVAQPCLIDLDGDKVNFEDLDEAMFADAEAATAIRILGGYYNKDALVSLCLKVPARPRPRRRDCSIRILVGGDGFGPLARTWAELQEVGETLRYEGFDDVEISLVPRAPVHFHTKLYGFLHGTQPIWYVGSANPGSKRHELMVRVTGRHEALTDYVNAARSKATLVTDDAAPIIEARTLQEFFMAGVLCHRPPTQRIFTFDAFRFSKEQREKLDQALGQNGRVLHARPKTEGYGFSLASAMGLESVQTGSGRARRVRLRDSCIYTVLGLWMPTAYADELHGAFAAEEADREKHLAAFSRTLGASAGQATACKSFGDHLRTMTEFLDEHGIDVRPVPDVENAFDRFLASRRKLLKDRESRVRLARMVTLQEMPDIWADPRAAKAFEDSFFEDLAYRAGPLGGNKGRLVRSLIEVLDVYGGPDTDDEFRDALAERLEARTWVAADWLGVADDGR